MEAFLLCKSVTGPKIYRVHCSALCLHPPLRKSLLSLHWLHFWSQVCLTDLFWKSGFSWLHWESLTGQHLACSFLYPRLSSESTQLSRSLDGDRWSRCQIHISNLLSLEIPTLETWVSLRNLFTDSANMFSSYEVKVQVRNIVFKMASI